MPSGNDEYVPVPALSIPLFDFTCCYCHEGRIPSLTTSLVDLDEGTVDADEGSIGSSTKKMELVKGTTLLIIQPIYLVKFTITLGEEVKEE